MQAWAGLAIARHLQGDGPGAAAALQNLLARHCLPEEPGFAALAQRIAQAAGFGGYRGMTVSGRLQKSAKTQHLLGPIGHQAGFNAY